jgi:hypothetical protein
MGRRLLVSGFSSLVVRTSFHGMRGYVCVAPPPPTLSILRPRREGYDDGASTTHRPLPAAAFVAGESPVEMLGQFTQIALEGPNALPGEWGHAARGCLPCLGPAPSTPLGGCVGCMLGTPGQPS